VAAIAAILGPTFFGNLFQTVLLVPYVICELMAGSLITGILAPRMVHAFEESQNDSAERLASGFLGVILLAFAVLAGIGALLAPIIVNIITSAVLDPDIRTAQMLIGVPLLLSVIPQILLYGVIGVSIAAQHSRRAFGVATAAPILENIGMVAVLGMSALLFGRGMDVERITLTQALLLGLGSTASVGLHAIAQWLGAYRLGITLRPTRGWRDQRVWELARSALPFCGTAGFNSLALAIFMIASGRIPGGSVAFHIGTTFFNLPVALCARPIAAAQLPILSREYRLGSSEQFRRTISESFRLMLFSAIPASLTFLLMPQLLAGAMSLGAMNNDAARGLIAAVLFGLAPGIIGEAATVVSTSACYARLDSWAPLAAMGVRFAVAVTGAVVSLFITTSRLQLLILSTSYSIAALLSAGYLLLQLKAHIRLGAASGDQARWIMSNLLISLASILPGAMLASFWDMKIDLYSERMMMACLFLLASGALYAIFQYATNSRELQALFGLRPTISEASAQRSP